MIEKQDNLKNLIIEIEQIKMQNDFERAYKFIQDSIIKYQDDYRLYEELADTSIYLGNIKKASEAIDYALNLNPESATGHYLKGFILLNQDEYKEALEHLEKSNSLIGNNSEVLRNLGWAYTMNNQVEKGIAILKRALNLAPGDRLITEDLAMALIGKGDLENGNKLLDEVKRLKQQGK